MPDGGAWVSKNINQKLRMTYLHRIMLEWTDGEHGLTMQEILKKLEGYGIKAERRSIYNDLDDLSLTGIDIEKYREGRDYKYRVVGKKFELAELKLLVDAIQSSKFITESKSRELIKKITAYGSRYEASQLQRQVYVRGRVKTLNEKIYYAVDSIHAAIANNRQIRFRYWNWNVNMEPEYRHEGAWYQISPWALTWDDENYYLVAYDGKAEKIKHYRVDKMDGVTVMDDRREGQESFERFDLAAYSIKNFGMYGGREEYVTVEVENDMVGVFIDRFGREITVFPIQDGKAIVRFKAAVSAHFYGWIFALGSGVKVTAPQSVVDDIKAMAERINEQYMG